MNEIVSANGQGCIKYEHNEDGNKKGQRVDAGKAFPNSVLGLIAS